MRKRTNNYWKTLKRMEHKRRPNYVTLKHGGTQVYSTGRNYIAGLLEDKS